MTAVFIPLRALFPAQVPTLGRQVQRAVSMAALAAVCEVCAALDQTPELQLDPPDAGPLEQLLAALPLGQRLQKPQSEENRCVPSGGGAVCPRGVLLLVWGTHACSRASPARCWVGSGTRSRGSVQGGLVSHLVRLCYGHP